MKNLNGINFIAVSPCEMTDTSSKYVYTDLLPPLNIFNTTSIILSPTGKIGLATPISFYPKV